MTPPEVEAEDLAAIDAREEAMNRLVAEVKELHARDIVARSRADLFDRYGPKIGADEAENLVDFTISELDAAAATERAEAEQASAEDLARLMATPPEELARMAAEDAERRKRAEREAALTRRCGKFNVTDIGNGQRFAARFGESVKYSHPRKSWFVWTGRYWHDDRGNTIRQLAKEAARAIYGEAAYEMDEDRRRKIGAWALSSESERRVSAMLSMASTEPAISILPEAFDPDGNLFNVENGTLNLTTLELQPHRREDLITKIAGTEYNREATCSRWLEHMALIFDGKEDMISAFQMRIGYYMLSGNPAQIIDIWWGSGENGKSVTLAAIRRTFGSYAYHASADSFMDTRADMVNPRPDLIALRGARLVTAAESERNKRLAESLIKGLTGGEPLVGRALFTATESFLPEFSPVLATNNDPIIRGLEHAIWRRIKKWPFTRTIPEDKKIAKYDDLLFEEAPGILAWAVEGLRRYYANGSKLEEPEDVKSSTAAYRASMDTLSPFIVERCTVKAGAVCNRTDLNVEYQKWCTDNGEEKLLPKEFYQALEDHDWEQRRTKNGRFFHGIKVKTPEEQADYEKYAEKREESYQSNLANR